MQDWPPCSPDLKPIENVWILLKKNVSKRSPKSMDKLVMFAEEEWLKLEFEHSRIMENLIN